MYGRCAGHFLRGDRFFVRFRPSAAWQMFMDGGGAVFFVRKTFRSFAGDFLESCRILFPFFRKRCGAARAVLYGLCGCCATVCRCVTCLLHPALCDFSDLFLLHSLPFCFLVGFLWGAMAAVCGHKSGAFRAFFCVWKCFYMLKCAKYTQRF